MHPSRKSSDEEEVHRHEATSEFRPGCSHPRSVQLPNVRTMHHAMLAKIIEISNTVENLSGTAEQTKKPFDCPIHLRERSSFNFATSDKSYKLVTSCLQFESLVTPILAGLVESIGR